MAIVDVIMPLYNKASTVARAIRSVQHQTVRDWRLIVVDDGSTDNGPEIVTNIADGRIEIVHQARCGPAAARNVGIGLAESSYLTFLDADDEWYPWFLANSLKATQGNNVGFVVSMYYLWPQGIDMTFYWTQLGVREGTYVLRGNEDPIWVHRVSRAMLALNVLTHTEIARKYDGFYEKDRCTMGEDTTFFLRLLFGESFAIIGLPAARYHTENSKLGYYSNVPRSLPPFLKKPETILNYCPEHKRLLCQKVLDLMALGLARMLARAGNKLHAQDLIARFPGTKRYLTTHYRCRVEIAFSRGFPAWIRLKRALQERIRLFSFFTKNIPYAYGTAPPMPYVVSESEQALSNNEKKE